MKNSKITNQTIIEVHFDNLSSPDVMTFMAHIDSTPMVLAAEDADINSLVDIRELAGFKGNPGSYHDYSEEMKEREHEEVHTYYYEVKNENFPIPFTDDDIPTY